MSPRFHPAGRLRLLALILGLLLVVAACGGDDSGIADMTAAQDGGAEEPAPAERDALGDEGEAADVDADTFGSGGVQPVVQPADLGRQIIYTADLTVAVTDVVSAGQEATRIISDLGGILYGQQTEALPNPRSVLIFKVAPADFQTALAALGSLGEVRTQNVSAEDVTLRVVDLESRIETAKVSIERLRGFLENATSVADIAELEAQLAQRESDLESMQGQLNALREQVALATITLTLTEALANPQVRLLASAYVGDDGGASCPGSEALTVDKGDTAILCFEIRNNGDTVLSDFTLVDTVLGLELDDLTIIDGDPTADLQPGQSLILAKEIEVERRIRTQTTVTAIPVNEDGTPLETRKVSSIANVAIRAEEPEGMPGFDDGVRVATDVLQWIGGVFVIGAGLAVPFLWLIPLVALTWWWLRRRRDRDAVETPAEAETVEGDLGEVPVAEPAEGDAPTVEGA